MASANPQDLVNLQSVKSGYLSQLAAEDVYCQTHAPKPSYSLDGESYQWPEWREAMVRKIKELNTLIQLEGGPYVISSRVRA